MILRFFDFSLSLLGLVFLLPIFIFVFILGLLENGSPLFFQQRVGKNLKPYTLIKFRTMPINTKSVATHLISENSVTRLGSILRNTKIDELPQLWNVLKGEMSLVGPRPNLFNQQELISERKKYGVYDVKPGITGLAQIKNIDMSTPEVLAKMDAKMISTLTVAKYFQYILYTVSGKGLGDVVGKKK